jgi:hypothetical protein
MSAVWIKAVQDGWRGKKDKFLSHELQLLKIAEEHFYLRCGSNAEGSI